MAYKRHKFPRTSRTLGQQMVKPRHWAKRVCFGLENLHLLSFLLEGHGNPKLTWTHRAIEPWLTSTTRYVSMIFNDVQWFSMCVPRIKKIKCSWLLAFKMNLALNCHELPHLCRLLCNCQSACCPWRMSLCHRVLVIWWQFIKLWGKCDMPMATTCYNKGCCGKTLCPNKSWEIWCILSATGSRIMPLAEGSLVCGSGLPASLCPRHKGQVQGHKNFRFAKPCPTFECKPFQRKSATLYLRSFGAAHLSVRIRFQKCEELKPHVHVVFERCVHEPSLWVILSPWREITLNI